MKYRIIELISEVNSFTATDKQAVEQFRLTYISKKGVIGELFESMKSLSPAEKKEVGKILNDLKKTAENKLAELTQQFDNSSNDISGLDLTLPPVRNKVGNQHPLTLTRNRIVEIFERLGFVVADGPEIEDDWHNFSALNFPENHPAREMQDTFFIAKNPDVLLRTHTSNVQVRLMKEQKPPTARRVITASVPPAIMASA